MYNPLFPRSNIQPTPAVTRTVTDVTRTNILPRTTNITRTQGDINRMRTQNDIDVARLQDDVNAMRLQDDEDIWRPQVNTRPQGDASTTRDTLFPRDTIASRSQGDNRVLPRVEDVTRVTDVTPSDGTEEVDIRETREIRQPPTLRQQVDGQLPTLRQQNDGRLPLSLRDGQSLSLRDGQSTLRQPSTLRDNITRQATALRDANTLRETELRSLNDTSRPRVSDITSNARELRQDSMSRGNGILRGDRDIVSEAISDLLGVQTTDRAFGETRMNETLTSVRVNIFHNSAQIIESHSSAPQCIAVDIASTNGDISVTSAEGKHINYAAMYYADNEVKILSKDREYRGRLQSNNRLTDVRHQRLETEDGGTASLFRVDAIIKEPSKSCNLFLTDRDCCARESGPVVVSYTVSNIYWTVLNELFLVPSDNRRNDNRTDKRMIYNKIARITGKIDFDVPITVYIYLRSDDDGEFKTDEGTEPYMLSNFESKVSYQTAVIEQKTLIEGIDYNRCYMFTNHRNNNKKYGYKINMGREIVDEDYIVYENGSMLSKVKATTDYGTDVFVEVGAPRDVSGEITQLADGFQVDITNRLDVPIIAIVKIDMKNKKLRRITQSNYIIHNGWIVFKLIVASMKRMVGKLDVVLDDNE